MFSERLDKLIQSSLQDGILTDQEKAAIIKRAKAEGEDIDEVEIYIDSLLQKRQKELNNSAVIKRANTSSMDELKKLIDAAMADGIITSKEREVITRKAAALGMDAAEVEVYLDAEIQKAEQAADMVKRDKIGKVCPQCGKQVPPLTIKCECGYEFTGQKQVSSVQILSDKIQEINNQPLPRSGEDDEIKRRNSQIVDLISVFPVPNTKEDIIEFLSLAAPNSKFKGGLWGTIIGRIKILSIIAVIGFILSLIFGGRDGATIGAIVMVGIAMYGGMACFEIDQDSIRHNKRAEAWKAKFDQVLMKGRSLRGDSDFQQQLDYFESMVEQ